ncbi:alkaline phosphatase PhoX [Mucisphaera sp.]|uniref:alkaline phosphatase PhoX n=1 Tax=Mucisphaera sp. TaxID=2913024 RepID=UPI003D0B8973
MVSLDRRGFLKGAAAVSMGFAGLDLLCRTSTPALAAASGNAGYGPLIPDPAGILALPEGFTYRVISKLGETMDDGLLVPGMHDGMAAFAGPDGKTIVVRNHEMQPTQLDQSPFGADGALLGRIDRSMLYDPEAPCLGGTTTLVYDTRTGELERHFLSLGGTIRNCAGGPTPWGSWITCEETITQAGEGFSKDHGYNFDVPASVLPKLVKPVALKAMGRMNHEAIAVDPRSGIVYQTEDRGDGLIYRFIPNRPGHLSEGGKLQALVLKDHASADTFNYRNRDGSARGLTIPVREAMAVTWVDVENVEAPKDDLRMQGYSKGAARFARGEGMWYGNDSVFFACTSGGSKRGGQVFRYVPSRFEGRAEEARFPGRLELYIEPDDPGVLDMADNLTVSPWGDVVICEDGHDEQFVVGVTPGGAVYKLAHNDLSKSEFAGACFSPDGTTMFVNIQKQGLTLAVTGPWEKRVG